MVMIVTAPPSPSAGVAIIGSRSALAEMITNTWIRRKALLLADPELPRFKIDGAVALETHGVGADQNSISQ